MRTQTKRLLFMVEIIIAGAIAITAMIFYFQFLRGLPSIHIEEFQSIPQASIITDNEGNELFRFYAENRRRTEYASISHNMINAIVATEDQGFRINEGVERKAIVRALWNNIEHSLGRTSQIQGASTITQQLIKNIMLTKEKKLKRKLQEIILAQRLTTQREQAIKKKHPHTNAPTIRKKAKEAILETYLNYVYYGNHSYGIMSAAENYFHTTPEKLTPLQSAILASLPQAPSKYNPLNNPETVIGKRIVTNTSGEKTIVYPHISGHRTNTIRSGLSESTVPIQTGSSCLDAVTTWGSNITIPNHDITYETGRKDRVLCRMYENDHISLQQVHDALLQSTSLTLHRSTNHISAPHFVFWVQNFLQSSEIFRDYHIDESTLSQAGWTIQTSLDPRDQQIAQEMVHHNMKHVYLNGGNNRALLHVDSSNGDVLAYVGSADYYNTDIKGQNDLIQSLRQVGSTIKPFIYSYLFMHFGRNIDTKISDLPLPAQYTPSGQPSNADMKYRGYTPIKNALAGSRNVPLVRIFYALGREWTFVPYLQQLGFTDLDENFSYGYSLLLGAGQGSMIQLANAYIELSSEDQHTVPGVNPIISITDARGNSIYHKENDVSQRHVRLIPHTVSYMIRSILSNLNHAPQDRYYYLSIPSMEPGSYALKTGTSEKKIGQGSYPNDAWIASYTNRDIIISRAGHTDGNALGDEGYGLFLNHRIIKDYYRNLIENNLLLGGAKKEPDSYEGFYPGSSGKEPNKTQQKLLQH